MAKHPLVRIWFADPEESHIFAVLLYLDFCCCRLGWVLSRVAVSQQRTRELLPLSVTPVYTSVLLTSPSCVGAHVPNSLMSSSSLAKDYLSTPSQLACSFSPIAHGVKVVTVWGNLWVFLFRYWLQRGCPGELVGQKGGDMKRKLQMAFMRVWYSVWLLSFFPTRCPLLTPPPLSFCSLSPLSWTNWHQPINNRFHLTHSPTATESSPV